MKSLHYAVVVGLICLAAALGVAGTYSITRGRIAEKDRKEKLSAVSAVVGGDEAQAYTFEVLNPSAADEERVTVARGSDGAVAGYAALGEAQGYGGKIRAIVGMDGAAEKIIGVTVLPHNETPGLGSRIAEVESSKTWWSVLTMSSAAAGSDEERIPEYLKQFRGLALDEVKLKGSGGAVQAITGATISSRGTVEAARAAVEKIRQLVRSSAASPRPESE